MRMVCLLEGTLHYAKECSGTHFAESITQCLLRSALLLLEGSMEEGGMLITVVV